MRAPVLLEMRRRRWPTTAASVLVVMMMVLFSLVPGTLTKPSEDLSLEDTVRVLRHFSAGVGARRGAGSGRHFTGHSHGNVGGRQSLHARLDSPEVHDVSKEVPSHPGAGYHGDDPLSLERESLEVTLGSSAVPAGATSGSQGFSSQYFVVGDDDNSIEIDEDDFRYMNLGRRYHPDGISPTAPQQLFIPQPAFGPPSMSPSAPKHAPRFNNPYIIATASSSEENYDDNPYEDDDDDDDDLALYLSKNLLSVKGEDSSEERLELDDALLGKRYTFIDGQGSQRWGYDLVDQYQHQIVKTDGTMNGRFGWTAPNGQEIKVQYVADDGGYRLVDASGILPMDSEDVQRLKIEHSKIHKEVANRRPVSPLPRPASPGVPLPPIDKSYKVTIPLGGAGVPLPGSQSDTSPFQGSPGFSEVGVPLPPYHGSRGQSFFHDDDEVVTFSGGTVGVPLPTHTRTGQPTSGVPLPRPSGPGAAPSRAGVSLSVPSGQPTGGVPLPRPSGPGAVPSRAGVTVGVELPDRTSGVSISSPVGPAIVGVPLPRPSGPGSIPSRPYFGEDDDTVVVGTTGGVALPGMPGVGTSDVSLSRPVGPGTGGVPLPKPPGLEAKPLQPVFGGDHDTVLAGETGGVALPGIPGAGTGVSFSRPARPEAGGVPLPRPSAPEPMPSQPAFTGHDDTVVAATVGGVALPGIPGVETSDVSLSRPTGHEISGVPLPSPSVPEVSPSGPGFFLDDETVTVGAGGGVELPKMPAIGASDVSLSKPIMPVTGGVPLPSSPSAPGTAFGDDEIVVVRTDGGVRLPGVPGTSGISLSEPVGPGTVGVQLPSPSAPVPTPPETGVMGDTRTAVFKGVSGAGRPGMTDVRGGGVPLPRPSGPEDDSTVVVGATGGVGLPGMPATETSEILLSSPTGPAVGGVPLPSPFGPEATPSDDAAFDTPGFDDATIPISGATPKAPKPTLVSGVGVALPGFISPDDTSASGGSSDFHDLTTGFGVSGPGLEVLEPGVQAGVSLPGFASSGDDSAGQSSTGVLEHVTGTSGPGFGTGVGVSLPGFQVTDDDVTGQPVVDPTIGFGDSGLGLEASKPGFGEAVGVSLPGISSPDDDVPGIPGFVDPPTGFDASRPAFGASGPGFGVAGPGLQTSGTIVGTGTGVSLPGFGSPDDDTVGRPGFDDSFTAFDTSGTGFGSSGPALGAPGPGFSEGTGVSLPGFGSPDDGGRIPGVSGPGFGAPDSGFGAGAGVSLPGFGATDDGATGKPGFDDVAQKPSFDTTIRLGASRPGLGATGPGLNVRTGVSLPGFGSTDDNAAGTPGFDHLPSGLGVSSHSFNGGGIPLAVSGVTDNGRPGSASVTGQNGEFGFSAPVGASNGFHQDLGGFGFQGGVPLNSGFGGSARFSGAPGIASPGFGRGGLDASEVPLQGPPVHGTFSHTTNLGQGSSSGISLNAANGMSLNKINHHTHGSSSFFEVGPPEPVKHAAGGPTKASPFPSQPHAPKLDSRRPNQFHSPSGPVRKPDPLTESSVNLASDSDKPQDLVKVYHDIYGIKMRLEDWATTRRREAAPANLELPRL